MSWDTWIEIVSKNNQKLFYNSQIDIANNTKFQNLFAQSRFEHFSWLYHHHIQYIHGFLKTKLYFTQSDYSNYQKNFCSNLISLSIIKSMDKIKINGLRRPNLLSHLSDKWPIIGLRIIPNIAEIIQIQDVPSSLNLSIFRTGVEIVARNKNQCYYEPS